MKHTLLAFTLAGVVLPSFAQSSVSIYGVLDAGVLVARGSVANSTQIVSSNLIPSRLGFRGTEDLGGGLSAKFSLELGVNNDTGAGLATNLNNQASGGAPAAAGGQGLTFNRQSWVGLVGSFGEVRLGRDYTPTYWTSVKYDPAFTGGSAASETSLRSVSYSNPGGARSSNAVAYHSPKFGGFQVDAMYALGENPSNAGATKSDGRYIGARLTYAAGPLDVSAGYAKYSVSAVGDLEEKIAGASYDFKVVKVSGFYTRNDTGSGSDMNGYTLGIAVPFGANQIKASYSTSHVENNAGVTTGDSRKIALQGIHYLSKRTSVYAIYAHVRNSNGASNTPFFGQGVTGANQPASAYSVGVLHTF